MIGRHDKYSGNILLYDYLLLKRAPIFLNRNLSRVLLVHQHLLEHGTTKGIPGPNHDLRSKWKPPSWDDLDDMIDLERLRGSFFLNVHGLKTLKPTQFLGQEPVRKYRNLFNINCTLEATIYPKSSAEPCTRLQPQKASLRGVDGTSGKKVHLVTDAMVVRRQCLAMKRSGHGPSFHESYRMVLSINFNTQQDAVAVYAFLGWKTAEDDAHTRLSTMFENILECPEGETILQLKDRKTRLDFGINVSMYWADIKSESVLTTHNQQLRSLRQSDSLPTPPLDPDKTKYELTFVYAKETLKRSGLSCPHEACRQKRPRDIDDLRMHLSAWHDYFKYQAVQEAVDDDDVEHWRFECDIADHRADQRASARANEPFDVHVMAPSQPFNQEKYLNDGNEEFQRTARGLDKTKKQSRPPSPTIALRRKPPEEVEDIPERRKKMYIVPRAPPGVTFFRSQSKRPLKEGEEISESDDEIDTTWVDLRKTAELERNKSYTESVKLTVVFDKFMSEESLHSDRCAGEALIRFVRSKGKWMWRESFTEDFTRKINQLLEDDVIPSDIHAYCLKLLAEKKPKSMQDATILSERLAALDVSPSQTSPSRRVANGTKTSPSPRKINKAKGKAKVTETGHLTPITADSDGDIDMTESSLNARSAHKPESEPITDPPFDKCFCGKDALSWTKPKDIVACGSVDCIRRFFHHACIDPAPDMASIKIRRWLCRECSHAAEYEGTTRVSMPAFRPQA